jgi:isopentenyl diphosphate isomerase/L-lactate dehydrogenase-like FMN-dependent dehydrogenase
MARAFRYQWSSHVRPITIDDYRRRARRAVPDMVWAYIENGSDDERTLVANREAFFRWSLRQRVLAGIRNHDVSTKVAGTDLALPVVLAPTGLTGLAHWRGEIAAARAAERAGTRLIVSTAASYSLEEIAKATSEDHWFQLYPWGQHEFVQWLLGRARNAGYRTLVVTVDVPVHSNRVGELQRGMGAPPVLTPRRVLDAAVRPRWWYGFLRHQRVSMRNLVNERGPSAAVRSVRLQTDLNRSDLSWDDLARVRDEWRGPMLVKGILDPEDAERAIAVGADGIVVSNHGGRQFNGVVSTLDALPDVVDHVGGRVAVLVDGGIRTGGDVVIALALGADVCLVGRAFIYGLAVAGEEGVFDVLGILRSELQRNLIMMGVSNVKELGRQSLHPAPIAPRPDVERGYRLQQKGRR